MWIDWIAAFLVIVGIAAGWRRGVLAVLAAFFGPLVAYVVAYLLSDSAGRALTAVTGLQPVMAYPVAGLCLFLGISLVFSVLLWRRGRRRRERLREQQRKAPLWDRWGGGFLGGLEAFVTVVLLAWAVLWIRVLVPIPIQHTVVGKLASRLAGDLTDHLLPDSAEALSRHARALARAPARTAGALSRVLSDARLQEFLKDTGSAADAASTSRGARLAELARDPEFMAQAETAGFVAGGTWKLPPEQIEARLGAGLEPLRRTTHKLASDPELRLLLEDPELLALLESRDFVGLANNEAFNKLASAVIRQQSSAATAD